MCMMAFGAVLMTVPENVQAAHWFGSSNHRQEYTVTNSELTAYTNVTVDIYLTEADNPGIFDYCLSNGYDIIFTNFESTTRLEHYQAYWDYADHDAMFSVVIPSIPASSTVNIWIYYGSPGASDLSDGDAVFGLFDDFKYTNYRNVTTDSLTGNAGGAMWEKYPYTLYTPDITTFETSQAKMKGISNVYDASIGEIVAYGSYMNTSYNCILGMNNTDGYGTDWTDFNTVMVNHSTDGDAADFIKATEPDFLTLISDSWHRSAVKDHGIALKNYTMYYTGLNSTNYSVCMATSPTFDTSWTKNISNPVLMHGTELEFDGAGCRKPVTWKDGEGDFRMIYSGLNSTTAEWKLGYAVSGANQSDWVKQHTWSVFNGSSFGWDNGTDIKALDIYHDGSKYVLIYSANDWQGIYRQGVITTTDFVTWTRQGGHLGIGDSTDWDGYNTTYATWMSDDNDRWSVYYLGENSTANVSMGCADVVNTTITSWSSWQRDCGGDSMAFLNAEDQLEVQWNGTMLERTVDLGNYSITVDMWASAGNHNESIFMRSDGGSYDTSEDYYALSVNSSDNRMDTLEWTGGTSALLVNSTFYYNGTAQQMLKLRCYGGSIYSYAEGMNTNNTASNTTYDLTIETGEIGLRVDTQPKVKFDNFRTLAASNGTITIGAGSAYDWTSEWYPGGGGGEDDIDIDDLLDETADVADDWDELFDDFCGTYWWMILIGIFLIGIGLMGSTFLAGILTRNQAIVIGALLVIIGLSLKNGEFNWLVIIGSVIIILDFVVKLPIPYLKRPMATMIGAVLILFGIIFSM